MESEVRLDMAVAYNVNLLRELDAATKRLQELTAELDAAVELATARAALLHNADVWLKQAIAERNSARAEAAELRKTLEVVSERLPLVFESSTIYDKLQIAVKVALTPRCPPQPQNGT